MDDNRALAEEVWKKIRPYLDDMHYICETIAAYGEARYQAGAEAMRDAAHPLMRWPEDHTALDAISPGYRRTNDGR
jgi:hypothetical protein